MSKNPTVEDAARNAEVWPRDDFYQYMRKHAWGAVDKYPDNNDLRFVLDKPGLYEMLREVIERTKKAIQSNSPVPSVGDAAMPVVAYAYDDPEYGFAGSPSRRFEAYPPGRAQNSEPLVKLSDVQAALTAKDAALTAKDAELDALRKVMIEVHNDLESGYGRKLLRDALTKGKK